MIRPSVADLDSMIPTRPTIVPPQIDDRAGFAHLPDVALKELAGGRFPETERLAARAELQRRHPEDRSAGGLRFYSPLEIAAMTTAEMQWIARGLAGLGAIMELDGKVKAAGKTTLMLAMARCVLDGVPFIGIPTVASKVLYITEQSRQTFIGALQRAGLGDRGDELRILFREDIGSAPWPAVVSASRQDGYQLVVFDTIGKLAGIREENAAGEWSMAMAPLQDLAASGRAVVILRHDRKGGGEVGESGRGSSQASGDVDIILALRRPEGHQPSNRRVIESLSRYPETPEKIVIELTDSGYVLLGTDEAVAATDALEFVSFALGSEYRTNRNGVGLDALVALGREREPAVKRTAIHTALDTLVRTGHAERTGRGVRGDPYLYFPPTDSPSDSFGTPIHSERIDSEPDLWDGAA